MLSAGYIGNRQIQMKCVIWINPGDVFSYPFTSRQCFLRPREVQDWERFDYYAPRVRGFGTSLACQSTSREKEVANRYNAVLNFLSTLWSSNVSPSKGSRAYIPFYRNLFFTSTPYPDLSTVSRTSCGITAGWFSHIHCRIGSTVYTTFLRSTFTIHSNPTEHSHLPCHSVDAHNAEVHLCSVVWCWCLYCIQLEGNFIRGKYTPLTIWWIRIHRNLVRFCFCTGAELRLVLSMWV